MWERRFHSNENTLNINNIQANKSLQMEHSYSRDWRPMEGAQVMTTKTILVHRTPQCPSCHIHSHDEIGIDMGDAYNPQIPAYNEDAAKNAMDESERVSMNVRTYSRDDEEWEMKIKKFGWTKAQLTLFNDVTRILDLDHLARLAHKERQHEPVLRRVVIDKSAARMRKSLAKIAWEQRSTQWLHGLLMDNLPPSYMASYLDILQTLKSKVPSLVDKMMFGRPISGNQDILGTVLKRAWEPLVVHKNRKLPNQPVIVIIPSSAIMDSPTSRYNRWHSLLSTMAHVNTVQVNINSEIMLNSNISYVAEQIVSIARLKIQEIRNETPNKQIILVGFNSGAALALQLALLETVNSVVCLGFAYNSLNGVRGAPDDRILDLTTPVLFVLGQNSARASQEEIESLREKMQAQTSLIVVGSADDTLRVGKTKRQIEGVTQSMVDNMVMDEIAEFATTCIINPPAPRDLHAENQNKLNGPSKNITPGVHVPLASLKKRKISQSGGDLNDVTPAKSKATKATVGRPRLTPLGSKQNTSLKQSSIQQPTTEALNAAIQSILPSSTVSNLKTGDIVSSYEIVPNPISQNHMTVTTIGGNTSNATKMIVPMTVPKTIQKVKMQTTNKFVQIKSPGGNIGNLTTQKMFTLKASPKVVGGQSQPLYTVQRTQSGTDSPLITTNKVFTVKSAASGTQLISAATPQHIFKTQKTISGAANSLIISPTKFTIVKPTTSLSKFATSTTTSSSIKSTPDLSSTNIFDLPIVFADNDGNITDTNISSTSSTTPSNTIVLTKSSSQALQTVCLPPGVTQATLPNRNIIINTIPSKTTTTTIGGNKVVLIKSGGQMKSVSMANVQGTNAGSIINIGSGRSVPPLKYTKVVVSNTSTFLPLKNSTTIAGAVGTKSTVAGNKVEILHNSIIKPANTNQTLANTKYQPIVINVDSDKTTIKNMIKVGVGADGTATTTTKTPNTILIKPGLKQIPMLKPGGLLNRSLTVRKVINFVHQKSSGTSIGGAIGTTTTSLATTTVASPVAMETESVVQEAVKNETME